MATRKPDNARVRTTPARAAAPSARRPKPVTPDSPPPRERARPRPEVKPVIGIQESWRHRIDPARVALGAVLVALLLCVALLVDVYLGRNDPVHVIMVTAFGPLAFLVPVGVGVLVLDFYRRHEGRRPWLRFEESCGAVLLFIATLTFTSLAALSYSLVGNSLSEELTGVIGRPLGLLVVLALLILGAVLAFRVRWAHVLRAWAVARPPLIAIGRSAARAVHGWQTRCALRSARRLNASSPSAIPATADAPLAPTVRMKAITPASINTAATMAHTATASPPPPTPLNAQKRWSKRPSAGADDDDEDVVPTATAPGVPKPVRFTARPAKATIADSDETPLPDFSFRDDDEPARKKPRAAVSSVSSAWPAPAVALLDAVPPAAAAPTDNDARAQVIEETLASFNVAVEVVEVQSGPTVTQFGLRPAPGVRVQRITALQNDLALALAAPSIRIEAPVPGKPVVGIEIPNGTTALVTLREILESGAYARMTSPLKIALGKDVAGDPVTADLAKMPHLLIAGATGSGKSVCLNSLIAGLLFHNSPDQLRLLMIDPKMVELTTFNGVPHLLHPVVTEMDKVGGTLKWALKEMHRRYKLFGEAGARNLARYNEMQLEKLDGHPPISDNQKPLPYIVFIIDELADLMMVSPAEVEDSISRLAALARATGIHLVLATQRPSVDVITGVIKANFPARIAFAVSSQVDSRTILDQAGAEKLLGRGDMLYLASDGSKAMRVQGTYLSDREIERLVEFWSHNSQHTPEQIASSELEAPKSEDGEGENNDKLFAEATKAVREYRRASVSLLQRRLSIGYSRAARLLDQLEDRGVVGPSEDGRSRVVIDTGDAGDEQTPESLLPDDGDDG